jgi:ribosome biogenesis GTPase
MGYQVIPLSLKKDNPLDPSFTKHLEGKTSFIMGPSGVGKSTLINRLVPRADVLTAEISKALQSGKHTTTATTLYWITNERKSAVIDSPGFQEFGLNHIKPHDLCSLMPDLNVHSTGCKFYNCTHLHEPGCVVRAQVELGVISATRYKIYGQLFEELSKTHY